MFEDNFYRGRFSAKIKHVQRAVGDRCTRLALFIYRKLMLASLALNPPIGQTHARQNNFSRRTVNGSKCAISDSISIYGEKARRLIAVHNETLKRCNQHDDYKLMTDLTVCACSLAASEPTDASHQ
jgi:hypothetical protein